MSPSTLTFRAPWSPTLWTTTVLAVGVLLSIVVVGLTMGPRQLLLWRVAMVGLPLATLIASLPFMVLGYDLTESGIEVRRLGFSTPLPLEGLVAVAGIPEGLRGSLRLFGNGGLFGITGWFWNRRLGLFRAFATDPSRVVLLRYTDGKKIVITPHDVQHFIVSARKLVSILT